MLVSIAIKEALLKLSNFQKGNEQKDSPLYQGRYMWLPIP